SGVVGTGLGFGRSGCLITLDDPAIDGKAAGEISSRPGPPRCPASRAAAPRRRRPVSEPEPPAASPA
ncbi:hypothetical protein, partial [Streptomyces anulatus]|uniref:hypothetical protein n=1 Tax=Streptomyces anulatus TaxID=1892 RepID=UPI0033EB5825